MTSEGDKPDIEPVPLPAMAAKSFGQSLFGAVIGAVVGLVIAAVPIVLIFTFDGLRGLVESNTYSVEAVDRQAFASETYTLLLRSDLGGGTTKVWLPGQSWCNQPGTAPADPRLLKGPAGTLYTVRYTRTAGSDAVTFDAKVGKFLFIGTQGDAPAKICFNESMTKVTISYDESMTTLDTGLPGRVLFVQMDEPGADIASPTLRDKTYVYLGLAVSFVGLFVLLLLVLGYLIYSNGWKDAAFRRTSSRTQSALHARVAEMDRRIDALGRKLDDTARDQEEKSESFLNEIQGLQIGLNSSLGTSLKEVLVRNFDELTTQREGAANPKAAGAFSHARAVARAESRRDVETVVSRVRKKAEKTEDKPAVAPTKRTSSIDRMRSIIRQTGE